MKLLSSYLLKTGANGRGEREGFPGGRKVKNQPWGFWSKVPADLKTKSRDQGNWKKEIKGGLAASRNPFHCTCLDRALKSMKQALGFKQEAPEHTHTHTHQRMTKEGPMFSLFSHKMGTFGQVWWYIPIISTCWEAKAGELQFQAQSGQVSLGDLLR